MKTIKIKQKLQYEQNKMQFRAKYSNNGIF